ncbi:MAG: hypothetical protein UV40_C0013G0003 [Parcubacteria group bacterium GW2011_GWA1_42_7]|nr:MAG: hypothetical protein UV34_C0029G0019 [Parcubacteria group bacterium GW2011_GWB1_42_6]KKS69858.1 MAG: hypothetical protein UV40_C0013G0003 [Parcubacteria group bacterium GW2011_GWA1_42_7]KKS91589.1 MAG: hypothetical protein UV67_C0024G0003 [Parcubacteria group bacterium GW2011_GWC1_43_12]
MDKFIEKIEKKFKVPDRAADKVHMKAEKVHGGYLIYESRLKWDDEKEWIKIEAAKIIFRKNPEKFLIYWKRASGKWEFYAGCRSFASALNIIDKDSHGCFWG